MKKVKTSHELLHEKMLAQKEEQRTNDFLRELPLLPNYFNPNEEWMSDDNRTWVKDEVLFTDAENSDALTVEICKLIREGKTLDEAVSSIKCNK